MLCVSSCYAAGENWEWLSLGGCWWLGDSGRLVWSVPGTVSAFRPSLPSAAGEVRPSVEGRSAAQA